MRAIAPSKSALALEHLRSPDGGRALMDGPMANPELYSRPVPGWQRSRRRSSQKPRDVCRDLSQLATVSGVRRGLNPNVDIRASEAPQVRVDTSDRVGGTSETLYVLQKLSRRR